ncbi:MAG: hypothetical protein AAB372_01740 [Patescibacteria group bacterium]
MISKRYQKIIATSLLLLLVHAEIALAVVPTWDVGLNGPPPTLSLGNYGILTAQSGWDVSKEKQIVLPSLDLSSIGSFASSVADAAASAASNLIPSWDNIMWYLTRLIVQELKKEVISWAQGGFQGGPSFIENPERFFTNVGDQASAIFMEELGTRLTGNPNFLCEDFSFQIQLALPGYGKYETRAGCTINKATENFKNMSQHFDNFEKGGWKSFVNISQEQNNFGGAYMMTFDARNAAINQAIGNRAAAAGWSQGYLGSENCPPGARTQYGCRGFKVQTPGKLIGDRVAQAVGTDFESVITADEVGEVIQVLIDMAIQKVVTDLANGDNE